MKSSLRFGFGWVLFLGLSACTSSPQKAAQRFLNAVEEGDARAVENAVTDSSRPLVRHWKLNPSSASNPCVTGAVAATEERRAEVEVYCKKEAGQPDFYVVTTKTDEGWRVDLKDTLLVSVKRKAKGLLVFLGEGARSLMDATSGFLGTLLDALGK